MSTTIVEIEDSRQTGKTTALVAMAKGWDAQRLGLVLWIAPSTDFARNLVRVHSGLTGCGDVLGAGQHDRIKAMIDHAGLIIFDGYSHAREADVRLIRYLATRLPHRPMPRLMFMVP